MRCFAANLLAAFGGISALIQFSDQVFPAALPDPGTLTVLAAAGCLVWGQLRAWPPGQVRQEFRRPEMTVCVEAGDLFDQPCHLVVGFSDTFDTAVAGEGVIDGASVQGQLLRRRYGDDPRRLDWELEQALHAVRPLSRERQNRKRRGKLLRYPLGTVAVLGKRPHWIFAVACSRLGNDYIAQSSSEELWFSMNRLWDAVYEYGEQERVAMPLVGAGLSRLGALDREDILRLILLSFVARSRERRICRELRIVVRPAEWERLDPAELGAFLHTLGARTAEL